MDKKEIVLNHLLDLVSHMENKDFQINEISYSGFQSTWKSLDPNICQNVGKAFKKLVEDGKVLGVTYKETLSDNHTVYTKQ